MSKDLERVIARLEDQEWSIRRLHRQEQDFRELCDDYRDVLDALERAKSAGDQTELERLQMALENEIAASLARGGAIG